jgi:hypothetical protein
MAVPEGEVAAAAVCAQEGAGGFVMLGGINAGDGHHHGSMLIAVIRAAQLIVLAIGVADQREGGRHFDFGAEEDAVAVALGDGVSAVGRWVAVGVVARSPGQAVAVGVIGGFELEGRTARADDFVRCPAGQVSGVAVGGGQCAMPVGGPGVVDQEDVVVFAGIRQEGQCALL